MMFESHFHNVNNSDLLLLFKPESLPQNNIQINLRLNQDNYNYTEPSNINFRKNAQDTLSILALNIRSLNGNFSKLKDLLAELNFNPTVILVSETWITENKPFIYSLKDYIFLNQPGDGTAGGAGIFF